MNAGESSPAWASASWGKPQEQAEQLVAVGDFTTPWELHLARGVLLSAGVPCHVAEEHAGNLRVHMAAMRLMVRAEDADTAQQLLLHAVLDPDGEDTDE